MQVVVAVADMHGPKAGLADAVLFPNLQRVVLEALQQRRQPAAEYSE